MTIYRGRPFSPVESQMDLMKSHTIRPVNRPERTEGGRTLQLAVPEGWTAQAKCIGNFYAFDDAVGLKEGEAAARCAGCPVIEQCLSAAMEEETGLSAGYRYTVRGGLNPKERAELEAQQRPCGRGHTGKRVWQEVKNGRSYWRCQQCTAEQSAERYGSPGLRATLTEAQRQLRAQKRVCCIVCRSEMHSTSLAEHAERKHSETEESEAA